MPLDFYLISSGILITVGVIGVLTQQNAVMIFMCVELMLNAANLSLVAFSAFRDNPAGQILDLFRYGCRCHGDRGRVGNNNRDLRQQDYYEP